MLKTILKFCERSDRVLTVMKTSYDKDVIDQTNSVYAENETKMS